MHIENEGSPLNGIEGKWHKIVYVVGCQAHVKRLDGVVVYDKSQVAKLCFLFNGQQQVARCGRIESQHTMVFAEQIHLFGGVGVGNGMRHKEQQEGCCKPKYGFG